MLPTPTAHQSTALPTARVTAALELIINVESWSSYIHSLLGSVPIYVKL